jgi:tRNA modification GTPase
VGKSSLLNAIVGFDRSITLDAAGTTRDVLHADTVIDGLPIRLSDTAGIHASDQAIERQGMAQARLAAGDADLVLVIAEPDGSRDPGPAQELLGSSKPLIRVMNKSDLLKDLGNHDSYEIATNALTGEGVEELMEAIADKLAAAIPKPAAPVPINDRQARLLREITMANSRSLIAKKLRELLGVGEVAGDLP